MSMFNRFCRRAALCGSVLLLSFSLSAHADVIQDANKLFKQKQYGQALKKVDGYLTTKPKDAQARFLKGLILTEQGKTDAAIKVFSALTQDYPELPEPYNNLAVLYAGQGKYAKARTELEMAIRTHPSYATAHENLGDIYAKMASQAYDRALQLDSNNTSTKTKLALIKELFSDDRTRAAAVAAASARPQPAAAAQPAAPAMTPARQVAATETAPKKVAEATPAPHTEPAKPAAAATPAPAKPAAAPVKTAAAPVKTAQVTKTAKAAPAPAATDNKAEVLKAVRGWASAWSAQDVKQYLGFYAPDFKTPRGMSRKAWESFRHDRLGKPKYIHVKVIHPHVKFTDAKHAVVTFRENYRASNYRTVVRKVLHMEHTGGQWLIREEH